MVLLGVRGNLRIFRLFKSKLVLTPDEPPPVQNYPVNPFYEPDYLETIRDPDVFPEVDVKLNAYDFQVLDTFTKFVVRSCKALKIKHKKIVPMPARVLTVSQLRPNSEVVDVKFQLNNYQRILKLVEIQERKLGLFCDFVSCSLPIGVVMKCGLPDPNDEEDRYVPDLELQQTKEELEALNQGMDLEDLAKLRKKEVEIQVRPRVDLLFGHKRIIPTSWVN